MKREKVERLVTDFIIDNGLKVYFEEDIEGLLTVSFIVEEKDAHAAAARKPQTTQHFKQVEKHLDNPVIFINDEIKADVKAANLKASYKLIGLLGEES